MVNRKALTTVQTQDGQGWHDVTFGNMIYSHCARPAQPGEVNDDEHQARWVLTQRVRFLLPRYLAYSVSDTVSSAKRVELRSEADVRWMYLYPSYRWDGASLRYIDGPITAVGALAHDSLYTLLRQRKLASYYRSRQCADRWMASLFRPYGAGMFFSCGAYLAVRFFGRCAARY